MKIEHIILPDSSHFLVMDGTRGPLQAYPNMPATHPAGFARFQNDYYSIPIELRGKLMVFADVKHFESVTETPVTECIPAKEKFAEYVEIADACKSVYLNRWEPAVPKPDKRQKNKRRRHSLLTVLP